MMSSRFESSGGGGDRLLQTADWALLGTTRYYWLESVCES